MAFFSVRATSMQIWVVLRNSGCLRGVMTKYVWCFALRCVAVRCGALLLGAARSCHTTPRLLQPTSAWPRPPVRSRDGVAARGTLRCSEVSIALDDQCKAKARPPSVPPSTLNPPHPVAVCIVQHMPSNDTPNGPIGMQGRTQTLGVASVRVSIWGIKPHTTWSSRHLSCVCVIFWSGVVFGSIRPFDNSQILTPTQRSLAHGFGILRELGWLIAGSTALARAGTCTHDEA